ncbi:MAG TPA: type II secretion system protein [Phycisphaerae bacterium]|nr:type II secretion system protein [Phycisphaerae bacterium]
MRRFYSAGGCGFTLIEVLVVVAILGLLVAVLVQSLKKAREQAQRTVCAAHLHQVMFGIFSYAGDHKGDGPMRGWFTYTIAEPKREAFGWTQRPEPHVLINLGMLWKKWVGNQVDVLYCPSVYASNRDMPIRPDKSAGGWKYRDLTSDQVYWIYGGYNYCAVLGRRTDSPNGRWGMCPDFQGINPLPPKAWSIYFRDTWVPDWEAKRGGVKFKMPPNPCFITDLFIGGFSSPHSDGKTVNVAYTDGHVRTHRTDGPITSGMVSQYDLWWYFSLNP